MKRPISPLTSRDSSQPYLMRVADLLSDDPDLVSFLGPSFKVVVSYNADIRRVTYSFRCKDDTGPDEFDIRQV
jgi:hypothetical protein